MTGEPPVGGTAGGAPRTWPSQVARVAGVAWVVVLVLCLAVAALAWRAGWQLQPVESASMEPAVPVGSLAAVSPVSPDEVEVGDVVRYVDRADPDRTVLHRVVGMRRSADGTPFVQTQGDANATPDPLLVPMADLDGRLEWHVPGAGRIVTALRPPAGLVLLTGVPLALVAFDLVRGRRARARSAGATPDAGLADDQRDPALTG